MFDTFNFGCNIKCKYIDFDFNEDKTIEQQLNILKEDLIQIEYDDGKVLDVGWYPEFSKNGQFKVFLIKDSNWDEPIRIKECKNIEDLKSILQELVSLI